MRHTFTNRRALILLCIAVSVVCGAAIPTLQKLAGSASESFVISLTVTTATTIPVNLIAIPEKRIPATGNNSTQLAIEVRDVGMTTPLYTGTVTTGSGGTYSGLLLSGMSAGTYDITAKGYSHLRRKMSSVNIADNITVDFTDDGDNPLLSGDVNGSDGDNKVNGIDLSLIVNDLANNVERTDLNQDGIINGIDLTNAVSNLNVTGDS